MVDRGNSEIRNCTGTGAGRARAARAREREYWLGVAVRVAVTMGVIAAWVLFCPVVDYYGCL